MKESDIVFAIICILVVAALFFLAAYGLRRNRAYQSATKGFPRPLRYLVFFVAVVFLGSLSCYVFYHRIKDGKWKDYGEMPKPNQWMNSP